MTSSKTAPKAIAVTGVVILSLWASIGSADPDSAAEPAEEVSVTEEVTVEESDAVETQGSSEEAGNSDEAPAEDTPLAFAEREVFGLDYDLLSANSQDMTDLQFADWSAEFVGTEVGWHGQVEEAQEDLFESGNFEVVVDVRGGSGVLERARLNVPREVALSIPAEAEIFFTGTIQEIDNTFSLSIELIDVTIEGSDGSTFEAAQASGETEAAAGTDAAVGDPTNYETWSTNAQEMTELQFDEWVAPQVGAQFTFTGQVESVDEALFDEGFEIVVDVNGGTGVLERARLIVTRDVALTVPADSQITFTGTLSEADNLISLSMRFRDVTFTIG